jgi:hypothetical protein
VTPRNDFRKRISNSCIIIIVIIIISSGNNNNNNNILYGYPTAALEMNLD